MTKLKGLRDDGSIDTKTLQSNEDIYKMVDYLAKLFENSDDCILERDGDKITWISDEQKPVVIRVSNLKGSDRANFLNSTGIIRKYNQLRKTNQHTGYPEIGSEIDIGGIDGYGFPMGTKGEITAYKVFEGDENIYAEILTSRGIMHIPIQMINSYSSK